MNETSFHWMRSAAAAGSVLALLAGLSGTAMAQPADGLIVKRDTPLRRAPADNAPVIQTLKGSTPVTRLPERQGAWVRVRAEGAQPGWVHMFDIGSPASATTASGGSNVLRGVGSLFGRGSSTTVATTTVGIRGLDEADIANAQPNAAEVGRAEALRASAPDAQQFAARSRLQAQAVDDLPVPTGRPGDAN